MHAEPLIGLPHYQILLANQLKYLAENSDIRWQHVVGSTARFNLIIPFCCELLRWQVEFQRVAGNWIPDLIFSEETFNPLLPSADEEPLGSFLVEWKLEDEDRLLRLMNRVVRRFTAHQRRLIQNMSGLDWRLQRAAEAYPPGKGSLQMLYTHGSPAKATFVVAIKDLDLSRLQPFLARNWAGERGGFPLGNLAQLLSGVALRVVWTIPGGSQPQVSYHMPEPLEALLGRPSPPAFGSRDTLEEYALLAKEHLERQCESAGESAMARQDLLEEIPKTKLGSAIEIDVIAARDAVYNLMHDGSRWTVWLYLNQVFPNNVSPQITLERQAPQHFQKTYADIPWSPRWTPKEMAKRISSFVSGEIKGASKGLVLTSHDSF